MRRDEFLRKQKVMRLATVSKDGMPHIVPVWYLYSGRKFYVGTNTATIKAKNVKRRGRAAFCIDEGVSSPIYGVMGRCKASLILGDRVRGIAERIISRYFKDMREKSAVELLDDTDCIIEMVPENITVWKY